MHFGKFGNTQELPGYPIINKGTFYCGKGGVESCIGTALNGGYIKYISRNISYSFIQNIKNKRTDSC